MNTKVLLLGAVVAAFTVSTHAAEPLLTPRAAGNQISNVTETPTTTITYVDSNNAVLTPRAAGNQAKVVKGANIDANMALDCKKNMGGSPKAVAECSAHTTMPGCTMVAMDK